MIHYSTAALLVIVALLVYYTIIALIGAMYPPAPGEERTRYAYWYRVGQLLAANIQRAAEHKFGDLAGPPLGGQALIASTTTEHRTEILATTGGDASAK